MTKLPAFEGGQLKGEFVDLGLAVQDVAVFGGNCLCVLFALFADFGDQRSSELTQLLRVQIEH